MVSIGSINFKRLSEKGYQSSDIERIKEIAKDVELNSKDFNLLVNGYGDGKSTTIESMLDTGDIFSMGNYDQIVEKMRDCESDHEFLGISKKYQLLVGQLKWLGFKWENDELVKDEDRVYQNRKPWVWNRQKEKIEKFDLEAERRKPYVHQIIDDIEEHGRKNALDYHKDKPIVEFYGLHLHPETRERTIGFTPIDMLDLVKNLNQTGDLIVDEGIGGEPTELGDLGNYADTIQKVTGQQVNSRTSKPKCKIPNIDNDNLETDIKDLWKKTREIYIDMYDALEKREADREKGNYVYCELDKLVDRDEIIELGKLKGKVRTENARDIPRVKEEKISCNDMDKICRINDLLRYADWLYDSLLSQAKIESYRDEHNSVKKVRAEYPKYYDMINYSGKVHDVYVLNASGDRDLPELYVERSDYFSPEVKIMGEEAGIETIDEDELVTKHFQFDYHNNSTMSKYNLASHKFKHVICKLIDYMDGDNFVTSVKTNMDGEKVPEMFETESTNFAKIEGSNKARNCDNLFVIGSNRLKDKKMWHEVKNRYQEVIEFTKDEWRELKDTETYYDEGVKQYGSQIGWKDPEEVFDWFEWEGDYDFNPLQKIWTQRVDRNKFEKMNRKRYQDKEMGEGCVINFGLRPKIGGSHFGKNKGDENDFVKWVLKRKDATPMEKAEWIKENIDIKHGFVERNLPDDIPLKVNWSQRYPEWKIDHKDLVEKKLKKKSWNKDIETGEETREEVDLYEAVEDIFGEDLPFSKKTLTRWVKDSIYLDYSPAANQNDSTTVKASEVTRSPWSTKFT